jgi:uncharacterized DUF497 family protein
MADLRFAWDARKNASNLRKHGVGFEARTAFYDERALVIDDPEHSEDEARFVLLGLSSTLRLLVVCHCVRESHGEIRITSARKADTRERDDYEERWTS